MKRDETPLLSPARVMEARKIGEKLARLRQADAALRAGLARSTVARHAPEPAAGIRSLAGSAAGELTQRVRPLGKAELGELNF